ncbi:MAG: hypothetical protein H6672_09625 [Anaerolineaceae bacterium]|nr:hypothetical protein [Anaerolineaceae bacterium]
MASSLQEYPQRDGLYRILPDGIAVHNRYADRIIMLDGLTSEIWLRADGKTTLETIARDLAGWRGESLTLMLRTIPMISVILNSEGIMFQQGEPATLPYHLSLPQEDQDADQMVASMLAAGWLDE